MPREKNGPRTLSCHRGFVSVPEENVAACTAIIIKLSGDRGSENVLSDLSEICPPQKMRLKLECVLVGVKPPDT